MISLLATSWILIFSGQEDARVNELRRLLKTDGKAAARAARDLGKIKNPDVMKLLIEEIDLRLSQPCGSKGHLSLCQALAKSLGGYGKSAVKPLMKLLDKHLANRDPDRNACVLDQHPKILRTAFEGQGKAVIDPLGKTYLKRNKRLLKRGRKYPKTRSGEVKWWSKVSAVLRSERLVLTVLIKTGDPAMESHVLRYLKIASRESRERFSGLGRAMYYAMAHNFRGKVVLGMIRELKKVKADERNWDVEDGLYLMTRCRYKSDYKKWMGYYNRTYKK